MSRELHCRDVGPDCDAVVVADGDEEILAQVAEHVRTVHDMTDEQIAEPDFQAHVKNQIHDKE
jgi:predicted small metal-binding protein